MQRRVAFTVVLVGLTATLAAVSPDFTDRIDRAQTLIYSERDEQVESALTQAEISAQAQQGTARAYALSQVNLLRAAWHNQNNRSREAVRAAQSGIGQIRTALEVGEFSDGLRVLADLHGQMMIARGLVYMIRNGSEARDAALRAVELDAANPRALISIAGFYLSAPPAAGGDVAAGVRALRRALALEALGQNDRFVVLGMLARAAARQNNGADAEQFLAQAEAIYPGTQFMDAIRREVAEAST